MGDFNDILASSEHSEFGSLATPPSGMSDFQRTVLHCQLSDMGFQGSLFNWCNKREEGIVCKKLDIMLINNVGLHRFTKAYVDFEPRACSDHMRSRIQIIQDEEKIKRPFKYVNAIGKLLEFLPMVENY